jgi:hypothetical protein
VTNDVDKLEKIWIVVQKRLRIPKSNELFIITPDMMPPADFSISYEKFMQDCTARIEK